MSDVTMDPANSTAPPLGLVSRLIGVITSPRATFERIVAAPKVLGALVIVALLIGVGQGAFLMSQRGQTAWLDMQAETSERFSGQPLPPERMATMEKIAPYVGYMTAAGTLVFVPIIFLIEAGVFFAIFTFMTGGAATFKQVLAVVAHAAIIGTLGRLFSVIVQFMRGTMSMTGAANLGVLMPMLPDNSFAAKMLGAVDLFGIWGIITISIGLGVLYKRRTAPIAITLFVLYAIFAACAAVFFPSR